MKIHQIPRKQADFQQAVDESELRSQLADVLCGQQIDAVTELDAGLFNNTYRIDTAANSYILKVSPHARADVFYNERMLMQREHTVAQQLCDASPLVPEYISFFDIDGRAASLQAFVQGKLWHDVEASLTEAQNSLLWQQLGDFSHTLNATQGECFGYPSPCDNFERWSEFIMDNVAGLVRDCERLGVMCEEVDEYLEILPKLMQSLDEVVTPVLCHGDLWPRNVIIAGDGDDVHIEAVIDAERAYWGDPVSDWVLILYGVPDAFWQGYGENLLREDAAVRIAIYKGMCFIVNLVETTRCGESDAAPRRWLAAINQELVTG